MEEGHELFLPTELTIEIHSIEVNVEVGRNLVSRGRDEWVYGLATEASVSRRLALLGELHGVSAAGSPAELIVNAGARHKITRRVTLMLALGRGVHGSAEDTPRLLVYGGATGWRLPLLR